MIKGTIKEAEREVSLCPLTGEILDWHSFGYYKCLQLDCSQVDKLDWKQIYGHAYRCEVEKDEIIDNLKKQQEWEEERAKRKAAMDAIFKGSLENARTIDYTQFIVYCDAVDQRINETIQSYNREIRVDIFRDPEDTHLVYIYRNDEVVDVSITKNICLHVGKWFEKIKGDRWSLSCCAVSDYIADAVVVNLRMKHNLDIKNVLHDDNPVYVKKRTMARYIDATYGWDWVTFEKARKRYGELTAIVNFDNVVYVKQELDEVVKNVSSAE